MVFTSGRFCSIITTVGDRNFGLTEIPSKKLKVSLFAETVDLQKIIAYKMFMEIYNECHYVFILET